MRDPGFPGTNGFSSVTSVLFQLVANGLPVGGDEYELVQKLFELGEIFAIQLSINT